MEMSEGSARLLAGLLEARTGQQLHVGRRWRIDVALAPLARRHGLADVDRLAAHIVCGGSPGLAEEVVDALLNNETSFFRDAGAFSQLELKGLDRLARERADTRRLAIWCAGCSTGQEVYSIAMLIAADPARWAGWTVEIVGTDVSARAVAAARAGRFGHFEIQRGLSAGRMVRWFERDGDWWQATDALRARVRFQQRSLLQPPPHPGRFDLILCRNVLLYFSPAGRRDVLGRLARAIAPDGVLMLGAGETVLGHEDVFVSDYEARGLYRPAVNAARRVAAA